MRYTFRRGGSVGALRPSARQWRLQTGRRSLRFQDRLVPGPLMVKAGSMVQPSARSLIETVSARHVPKQAPRTYRVEMQSRSGPLNRDISSARATAERIRGDMFSPRTSLAFVARSQNICRSRPTFSAILAMQKWPEPGDQAPFFRVTSPQALRKTGCATPGRHRATWPASCVRTSTISRRQIMRPDMAIISAPSIVHVSGRSPKTTKPPAVM